MGEIVKYLEFKREVEKVLQEKIDDNTLKNKDNVVAKLYWGRREPADIFSVALPEIQLISSTIHTPGSITDQEPFAFPKTNAMVFRLVDMSHIDAKDAEEKALGMADLIADALEEAGSLGGKLRSPVLSSITFMDMYDPDQKIFYHGCEMAYEANFLK